MKKLILPTVLLMVLANSLLAQKPKGLPRKPSTQSAHTENIQTPLNLSENGVPETSPVFQQTRTIKSLGSLPKPSQALPAGFKVLSSDNGLPTMISGTLSLAQSRELPLATRANQYLDALKTAMEIKNPSEEFEVEKIDKDDLGQSHIRMQQKFAGVPVWGSEIIVHEKNGRLELMNGNYFPTPFLMNSNGAVPSLEPSVLKDAAEANVKTDLIGKTGFETIKNENKSFIGGEQLRSELVIFHVKDNKNGEKLAWHVTAYPNMLHRYEYFVDAENGKILDSYGSSCNFMGHRHNTDIAATETAVSKEISTKNSKNTVEERNADIIGKGGVLNEMPLVDGKFVANSQDLLGLTRAINTYQVGTKYYLIDASRAMYKSATSILPNKPIGVIQTFDYKGTDEGPAFFITSANNTWTDKKGVSAHYNAGKTYDYYLTTHGRNSINGQGGNIESFINVTENNKVEMDNAYWNGEAMFYGNGKDFFTALPKALDVAGHEISHGVIQNTANLRYQGESGALNESYADIFGAMIDRTNWKMGEDIVKNLTAFPSGALRDLSNPHNGASNANSPAYQPQHYDERYKGTEDDGGVHINSGITNYAFYLFANNAAVGKDKAEKIYYRALDKYLVASSKFIDLRAVIEQSCKDLYPSETALLTAAQTAFTQVGIGGGGSTTGTTYQQDIPVNPGADYIVYVSNDGTKLMLTTPSNVQPTELYKNGIISRPSVTDDGSIIVFIGTDKKMHRVTVNWTANTFSEAIIQNEAIWHNVAVSKDGRKLVGNFDDHDSTLWVYSYDLNKAQTFVLYNPTTANGAKRSNEVRYSDAFEWEPFGEWVMYDAFNSIPSTDGANLEYWDVGFINVWSNTTKAFAAGKVEKLFNSLPENISVGNPTFAKNSPYIVAFDLIESSALLGESYYIYGANIQTGDLTTDVGTQRGIVANNTLGYPSFSRQDNRILYTTENASKVNQMKTIALASNKINAATGTVAIANDAQKGNWFGNAKRVISATNDLDKTNVAISPNPFYEILTIDITAEKSGEGKSEIFDLLGRRVLSTPLNISTGKNAVSIDTRSLNTGWYLIKISVNNNTLTSKIVKF